MAKILVVDDIKDIRDLVQAILTKEGHIVHTADSALSAIEALDVGRFDLGIFDVDMPYKDGFELVETIRGQLRFKLFPIIFLTARRQQKDVERAIKNKADNYLLKPIKKLILINAVNKIIMSSETKNKSSNIDYLKVTAAKETEINSEIILLDETSVILKTKDSISNSDKIKIKISDPVSPNHTIEAYFYIIEQKLDMENMNVVTLSIEEIDRKKILKIRNWLEKARVIKKIS